MITTTPDVAVVMGCRPINKAKEAKTRRGDSRVIRSFGAEQWRLANWRNVQIPRLLQFQWGKQRSTEILCVMPKSGNAQTSSPSYETGICGYDSPQWKQYYVLAQNLGKVAANRRYPDQKKHYLSCTDHRAMVDAAARRM
jgi:hypothetical protein